MTCSFRFVLFVVALTMLIVVPGRAFQASQAQAAQPHSRHAAAQAPAQPSTTGKMTMDCHSMMAAHQKMAEEMKAMDARLETLVQTMNGATGQAKVDATSAVVTELVSQRKTMREGMEGMHASMMQHMMEHMQSGDMQAMMNCPMMKMGGSMKH